MICSPELRVLGLGLLEDGDVRVNIFPQCEEVLIGGSGLGSIALQCVGAPELQMDEGADGFSYLAMDPAACPT